MPAHPAPRVERRTVLIGAGALGLGESLAACANGDSASTSTPAPPESAGPPQDQVRRDVATAERALIAAYDAVIAAFPDLTPSLAAIRSQHDDHLRAMAADGDEPAPAAAPASAAQGIAELRAAEQQAARDRRSSCVAATDADLARVLALIAASEQSHAAYLRIVERA